VKDPRNFVEWVCDPATGREARFAAQVLVEQLLPRWKTENGITFSTNYEAERLARKERALNPAFEPEVSRDDAERIAVILPKLVDISLYRWDDRPVRDLSVLQFLPALEKLRLHGAEILDYGPLAYVPLLRELRVGDNAVTDLRPIARHRQLELLTLTLRQPWPDLTGLENLTALRHLEFWGNVLALTVVPRLAGVRYAKIHQLGFNVPLRQVSDLPEMPELRRLFLENTTSLTGLERSPHLLNLEIYGYFDSIEPVRSLRELTHAVISGGEYRDVSPAALPKIRRLTTRREKPLDYSCLADAPRLHEVKLELCAINKMEVAALNAALPPWGDEFTAEFRPLQPLALYVGDHDSWLDIHAESTGRERDWGEDEEMANSEARWFASEVNTRLGTLLGKRWGWLDLRFAKNPGHKTVTIVRPEDLQRLPEIVERLRRLMASCRYPWYVWLMSDSLAEYEYDMKQMEEEERGDDEEAFDAEKEQQEWEYNHQRLEERRKFFEREYRYHLLKQDGMTVRPADFAPPKEELPEKEADSAQQFDLGTDLQFTLTVNESGVYVYERQKGIAEYMLSLTAQPLPSAAKH
jgi:hypothetical protein